MADQMEGTGLGRRMKQVKDVRESEGIERTFELHGGLVDRMVGGQEDSDCWRGD
jgi:hypothetical protein